MYLKSMKSIVSFFIACTLLIVTACSDSPSNNNNTGISEPLDPLYKMRSLDGE